MPANRPRVFGLFVYAPIKSSLNSVINRACAAGLGTMLIVGSFAVHSPLIFSAAKSTATSGALKDVEKSKNAAAPSR